MSKTLVIKLASAAALAGSSQAYGQIVNLTLPSNITGIDPAAGGEVDEYYNVPTGTTDSSLTAGDNFRFGLYQSQGSTYFFTQASPISTTDGGAVSYPGGFYLSAVAAGAKIGSDTYSFTKGTGSPNLLVLTQVNADGSVSSNQQPNTDSYFGFQFKGADGLIHNGYLELESNPYVNASNPGGLIFLKGAYNSLPDGAPGGSGDIEAGEVATAPEPGTLSALVLGAAALGGVGFARRRRSVIA